MRCVIYSAKINENEIYVTFINPFTADRSIFGTSDESEI